MDEFSDYLDETVDMLPKDVSDKIHQEFLNLYSVYANDPSYENLNQLICAFQEVHCDLSDRGEGILINVPGLQELQDGMNGALPETREQYFLEKGRRLEDSDVHVKDHTAAAADTLENPCVSAIFDLELELSRNNCCEFHHMLYAVNIQLFTISVQNSKTWTPESLCNIYEKTLAILLQLRVDVARHLNLLGNHYLH